MELSINQLLVLRSITMINHSHSHSHLFLSNYRTISTAATRQCIPVTSDSVQVTVMFLFQIGD